MIKCMDRSVVYFWVTDKAYADKMDMVKGYWITESEGEAILCS